MSLDNSEYADEPGPCASGSPLQLAIRETRRTAASARFWSGLAAVILILAIAAPFDTAARFSFSTLIVYWGAIAVCTFFIALPVSVAVSVWSNRLGLPMALSWLSGGIAAGAPVAAFVTLFNRVFFDIDPMSDHGAMRFILECMLIAIAVVLIFQLAQGHSAKNESKSAWANDAASRTPAVRASRTDADRADRADQADQADQSAQATDHRPLVVQPGDIDRTPFHQRLNPGLGNDIVTIQAQDHYVDVTTTAGHEMLLMRLADAERELDALPGMRVHRSWWVAERHMCRIVRQDGRSLILLDTGKRVPVSRSRLAALRNTLARQT